MTENRRVKRATVTQARPREKSCHEKKRNYDVVPAGGAGRSLGHPRG